MSAVDEFRRGWPLLTGATLGALLGISALPFYTFGIFMNAIEADVHWARSEIALAQTAWAIALALVSPFMGGLIDKVGHRVPMICSFGAIVACFVLLGTLVDSPWAFVAVYTSMAMLGAASSPLPFAKVVSVGFERARGIALGVTLTGTGLSAILAPMLLNPLIQQGGWRLGYLGLAAVVALLAPLSIWLLGAPTRTTPGQPSSASNSQQGLAAGVALRKPIFWQLSAIFFLVTFAASGLVAHLVPILTESGASAAEAASIVAIVGVSVMIGRLTVGVLIDIFPVRNVAASAFLLTATGCFLLFYLGPSFAWITALGVGFALGTEVDLMGYCTARYFGFRSYGVIYGTQYGLSIVGVALSPVWMAVLSQSHGYATVLIAATLIALLASILCLALPSAQPRTEPARHPREPGLQGRSESL